MLLTFFARYGAIVVAPISFVENLVGLNVYFPGSIAILTAMALSAGDPHKALATFVAITVPAFLAHQVNFVLGKRLRGREVGNTGRYKTVFGRNALFAGSLWHPHFAALACIDAGSQGLSYGLFLSAFAPWFAVWNIVWALVMYNFGLLLTRDSKGNPLILGFLALWLLWDFFDLGRLARGTGITIRRWFKRGS